MIEHHETFVAPRASTVPTMPATERVSPPAVAQWLEEDRSAPDPLVEIAETDALRELMQRVRQWTSSAPTVIETAKQAAPLEPLDSPAPVVAAPAPQPSHVSIGNVVITVEDAPAATSRGARSPSPARSATDRMARNYIRGG